MRLRKIVVQRVIADIAVEFGVDDRGSNGTGCLRIDWIGLSSVLRPHQHSIGYRLYGRRFLQVKRPNQQYQITEGTYSTEIT